MIYFDDVEILELKQCTKEIKKLIEQYGNMAIYKLDSLYAKYGVDIVNAARRNLNGEILGL